MSCSNAPPDGQEADGQLKEEILMTRKPKLTKATCIRCRENRSTILAGTSAFCRTCFSSHFPSKVLRSANGAIVGAMAAHESQTSETSYQPDKSRNAPKAKSNTPIKRAPPQQGNVLIGLSGGAGSQSVVDILAGRGYFAKAVECDPAQDMRGKVAPVWQRAWACHVDFSNVIAGTMDQSERLRVFAHNYGLEFVSIKAEDAFAHDLQARVAAQTGGNADRDFVGTDSQVDMRSETLSISSSDSSSKSPLESLSLLLASLPPTSRPAFLSNLLNSLLSTVAQSLPSISHILLGDTASRQAQNIIASTASGSGWSLPLQLASWTPVPDSPTIVRIKPMKQALLREAAYWCHLHSIETFSARNWHTIKGADGAVISSGGDARGKSASATLEGLTEHFIAGLGSSHPSTVSTISRTGEKLMFRGSRDPSQGSRGLCPICQTPAEPSSLAWKSRTALTSFPHKQQPMSLETIQSALPDDGHQMAELLCYGCLTAFTAPLSANQMRQQETESRVTMPVWVQHRLRSHATRAEMREEIAEFIMDDKA